MEMKLGVKRAAFLFLQVSAVCLITRPVQVRAGKLNEGDVVFKNAKIAGSGQDFHLFFWSIIR